MKLVNRTQCTGCMACVQNCPKNCIRIEKDRLGNLYPIIDEVSCVECGKCKNTCPESTPLTYQPIRKAYAVWSLDSISRKSSASGGAAAEFYAQALQDGYWICGVEYKNKFQVVHTLSQETTAIAKYKQSKYVYSEVKDVYVQIRERLENNDKVLVISLPCKIAGLLGYLGKDYNNLITVDIVCHGTPSNQMLEEYIFTVDTNNKASKLSFRNDNTFVFELQDSNDKSIFSKIGRTDAYLAAFLEGLNYRESCYNCSYARPERVADITICDFWGLGQEKPFDHPYTGSVSAVLINNEKGQSFFGRCRDRFSVEERPISEAVNGNAQLNKPTSIHPKRTEFETQYAEKGFEKAVKCCLSDVMREEKRRVTKQKIYGTLRKIIKSCIGR